MTKIYILIGTVCSLLGVTCHNPVVFVGASTTQWGVGDGLPGDPNWVDMTNDKLIDVGMAPDFTQMENAGCGGSVSEHFTGEFPIENCGARVDGGPSEDDLFIPIPEGETPYTVLIAPSIPLGNAVVMFGVNTAGWCIMAGTQDPVWYEEAYCLDSYKASIEVLIEQLKADGADSIYLMPPPPVPEHYNQLLFCLEPGATCNGLMAFLAGVADYDIRLRPQMPAIVQAIANADESVILGPNVHDLLDPLYHFDIQCCDSHTTTLGHQIISDAVFNVLMGGEAEGW